LRSFCWTSSQTWSGPAAGQQADSTKADQSQRCGVGNHGQDQIFYQTVYHHFNRWRKQAVFDRLADRLRLDADRQGLIDGSLLCADGTNIRAAASASGSRLSPPPEEPDDHALGRSRGGPRKFGSKLHVLTCGEGIGLAATLTPGQAHESKQLDPLLSKVKVGRRRRGRACAADRA
jgi:transposase